MTNLHEASQRSIPRRTFLLSGRTLLGATLTAAGLLGKPQHPNDSESAWRARMILVTGGSFLVSQAIAELLKRSHEGEGDITTQWERDSNTAYWALCEKSTKLNRDLGTQFHENGVLHKNAEYYLAQKVLTFIDAHAGELPERLTFSLSALDFEHCTISEQVEQLPPLSGSTIEYLPHTHHLYYLDQGKDGLETGCIRLHVPGQSEKEIESKAEQMIPTELTLAAILYAAKPHLSSQSKKEYDRLLIELDQIQEDEKKARQDLEMFYGKGIKKDVNSLRFAVVSRFGDKRLPNYRTIPYPVFTKKNDEGFFFKPKDGEIVSASYTVVCINGKEWIDIDESTQKIVEDPRIWTGVHKNHPEFFAETLLLPLSPRQRRRITNDKTHL